MNNRHLLREISQLCEAQEQWRGETLNLIASENVLSPASRALLDNDFHHRYAEGHPGARYYEGTRYVDAIEERARDLIRGIFDADHVDVRLPSGTMANDAVFSALMPDGGTAVAHGIDGGGHISHARFGALGKRADRIAQWPRTEDGFHVDVAAAKDMLHKERPRVAILGRSLFLFPEPVADLRPVCEDLGIHIVYDASHVLGLIAGGQFQDPLAEGADVITASTHKTFFGPQRGIILSRGHDDAFWKSIDRAVFPGVTSNHHLFSLPSLCAAALEIRQFGRDYARDVVANARAFAAGLHRRGFPVAGATIGYTCSHQVAVDAEQWGGGRDVARRLCENGIVCNFNLLPGEPRKNARNPRGLRFGVQEMTRYGMAEGEMDAVAGLIHDCIVRGKAVAAQCRRLREAHPTVQYGFDLESLGRAEEHGSRSAGQTG